MKGTNPTLTNAPTLSGYRRIEIDLRRRIGDGGWPVGTMLPSRRDLAREYSVSLVTLDRAIGPLLAEGILRADDRRGTFVSQLSAETQKGIATDSSMQQNPATNGVGSFSGTSDDALKVLTIGIVATVSRIESQEYLILHELEQVFSQRGISTRLLNRAQDATVRIGLRESMEEMLTHGADGIVVICLDLDKEQIAEQISQVQLNGIPTVCILAGDLNLALPHVFYDNRSGGFQAVQHLFERGWSDISVIAPFTASWVSERVAGVKDAVMYSQFHANNVQVFAGQGSAWESGGDPRPIGYRAAKEALRAGWQLNGGIVCVNDGVAFGVLDAAAELNLEAGKDFAILGFDDESDARFHSLTSLRPPMQGMAREAARLLMDHARGSDGSLQVRLRAHVIARGSTRVRLY